MIQSLKLYIFFSDSNFVGFLLLIIDLIGKFCFHIANIFQILFLYW